MGKCPIDLIDPETFRGGAPRQMYRELRLHHPVYKHPDPEDEKGYFWAITRQKELDYVSKNPRLFSSHAKTCFYRTPPGPELDLTRMLLINMDPPEHVKYRRIIRNAFTPRTVDSYEPRFREIIKEVFDRVVPKGRCEFISEVACELPLMAICELVGVPTEDRRKFFEWTNIMIGADDPELSTAPEDGQNAAANVYMYADRLMELHRENPTNPIIAALLDGVVEGEHLSEDEFRQFILLLIVAGNETTRTVTSQGMRLLIEHPEQFQMLVDNPSLIPDAIEEMLRYNTAVIHFRRTAMDDVELEGEHISKGDKVMMFYQAASADEAVFDDPDTFDITRGQREDVRNGHRAFGIGEHFCLGSHLARLELLVTFEELVKRIRNPRLDGEMRWLRSNFIHGIKEMPIAFDPA